MSNYFVALFVLFGWVFSLCLHEFGHAYVAYLGGDKTIKEKGYLTFNPFAYTDLSLSIVLPTIFVLLGGIGLPGASVLVNERLLRNRFWSVAVSAAGPFMTLLFTIALVLLVRFWPWSQGGIFLAAAAFLAELEMVVLMLNLLPVPGLDGFGIIEPLLPSAIRKRLVPLHSYGFIILFAFLWVVPAANYLLWNSARIALKEAGIASHLIAAGQELYSAGALPIGMACIAVAVIVGWLRKRKSQV